MNYIPMNILEYRFDEQGVTQTIVVAFQHYQGEEQISVRVLLDQEYVTGVNPKLVLDAMTKEQIESFARRKIRDWVVTTRPVVPEEPEVEE